MNDIHVTLTGNVAAPPRQHTFPDGSRVTSLKIASTSRYFDRENQQWRNGETTYFGVRCFRGLADNVAQSVRLGQPVIVQGRLRIREFTHEGERRFMPEVEAGSLGHDLRWGLGSFSKPQRGGPIPALGSAERSELDRETSDWAMSGGVPVGSDALAAARPDSGARPGGEPGSDGEITGGSGAGGETTGEAPSEEDGAAQSGSAGVAAGGIWEAGEIGETGSAGAVPWEIGAQAVPGAEPAVTAEIFAEIAGSTPHAMGDGVPAAEPAQGEVPSRRRRTTAKGAARRADATAGSGPAREAGALATMPDEEKVYPAVDDEVPWPVREHVAA
ncbi:single-stranded DNA-binding protein [Streptosporangium sp. NPDC050855]|uniref:single-stranded DNA-binding protein n=1 Tax=Streptosporangium sp. NPDC050855 TaxID=3366194 RepID=UPI003795F3A3